MPSRKSLRTFLATARSALAAPVSKRTTPLIFVVGNESADLDSLCSALLFAYLRTFTPPYALHIPLCHLNKDDLTLRPEFTAVLKDAGATPDDVITLSELPGAEHLQPEDTEWLLVDHNAMTGRLGEVYGSRIVGCIDHHVDEGKAPRDNDPRVIDKAGSCMSLIIAQCKEAWDGLSSSSDGSNPEMDAQLATLAIAPILIDTTNLGDKNKTTEYDTDAIAYLESKVGASVSSYERGAYYRRIADLKEDITPLSIRDVLRKDYKEWEERGELVLGTSSSPQNFQFLVDKAGGERAFLMELEKWAEEKKLSLVAILTACRVDGAFTRELLIWGRGKAAVSAAQEFEKKHGDELELKSWSDGKLDCTVDDQETASWRRCWKQGQVQDGRKQIAPILREVLKSHSG